MKTRILAAIAIAAALPAIAQANSAVTERHFDRQSQALNIEQTAQYHALPTRYSVDTVQGGHSAAADAALNNVASSTQLRTHVAPVSSTLANDGQSDAAAQALQNVSQVNHSQNGSVEVSFTQM
ncbi:hypothetical protein [Salinicola rhizosphaerae]|uniref:DUF4148 domain-containing protein n=1 Tax=Salinicola rhizosphaerae TaxID=1443141 RepID=A0ABQ3DSU2_9GAMM|nr:hypothetical protein [Salinicola rhizosphaerae]GHB14782.1 hypothetical protein GCM10009038_11550 [Salinicola rhizosphaerae]